MRTTRAHDDEYMPTMVNALELSDEQFDALLRLTTRYRRQALKCLHAKAYLAGAVMVGAALEAFLMALVFVRQEEAITWTRIPKRKGQIKPLLEWNLGNLLQAAEHAGWLPRMITDDEEFSHKKAAHGDYAKLLQLLRNLVHPARYLEDFAELRMTKRRLDFLLKILGYLGEHLAGVAIRDAGPDEQ